MRRQLKALTELIAPQILHMRRIKAATAKEKEIGLLPLLCGRDEIAVDVGANQGLYVHHLIAFVRVVYAFEPLPAMQRTLERFYGDRIKLERVALSDRTGQARIRMPTGNASWATLAGTNTLELADPGLGFAEFDVETRRLDEYALRNVGFIKIDVEGHEEMVLRGAVETIQREQPNVVIEVEERHNAGSVRRVETFMSTLGYSGYFISHDKLVPMTAFDESRDQQIEAVSTRGKIGHYINNFIYVPRHKAGALLGWNAGR